MKIKIAILTFHASHNYGSMLQAYALQTYLEQMGCEAKILNYRGVPQQMFYHKPHKYWDVAAIKGRIRYPILFYKNIIKWRKFEQFMCKNMHLTVQHTSIRETKSIIVDGNYDAVISGGDQIWAVISHDFYLGYFLPFDLPDCKKISYAPSFGDFRWTHFTDAGLFFTAMLNDYDHISIREKSAIETLRTYIKKPIVDMPDPAFLLTPNDYNKLTSADPLIHNKYLFYYDPIKETDEVGGIWSYAKKNGLVAVNSNSQYKALPHFHNQNASGPSEFINLVRNATVICGRSMHMIVFALLYHKPFFVISDDPDIRLTDLLEAFSIEDRIVTYEQLKQNPQPQPINWEEVDATIGQMRERAKQYLTSALIG